MESQNLASIAFQTLSLPCVVLIFYLIGSRVVYAIHLAKLPALDPTSRGEKQRQTFLLSAKKLYEEGYQKFQDSVYRICTSDGKENVVVPLRFLPELRRLPDDVLSLPLAINEMLETKYTGIDTDAKLVFHSVKSDLTPALNRLNPTICAEVDESIKDHMPECKDWTEVIVYRTLVQVVAQVSGRIFVGPKICQDPEYLDIAMNYTTQVIDLIQALKQTHSWVRPFVASRLPALHQLRETERRAARFLEPIIRERRESQANIPKYERPDDMLQWMMDRSADSRISVEELSKNQLGLIFAAVHSTTMTATNILYTLAITPDCIEPIRKEIKAAIEGSSGIIDSRALQQMGRLDSYMKEVMRFFPPNITSFERRVLKGITLSNGQYIPPGVNVEVPALAIYNDPNHYPDSEVFDGFRHYKLRQEGTTAARTQFVTTNEENLAFGYGRHACPGRFFAANEIKMIFSRIILEYDVKMPEGATRRHDQIEIGKTINPNPEKIILFKKAE